MLICIENGVVTQIKPYENMFDWIRAKAYELKGTQCYRYHAVSQTFALPGEYGWRHAQEPPEVLKLAVMFTN